jgi:hypothetical protein
MASAQPTFLSPSSSSFDLGDYAGEASNPNLFDMGMYPNPFAVNDMPMVPGTFANTFSWVSNRDLQTP